MFAFLLSILLSSTLALSASDAERKGYKIAKHCQDANSGFRGEHSVATMLLLAHKGKKVQRRLEVKRREVKRDGNKSLLKFLKPADVKGTKLLTWAHKNRDDDQWIYLPSFRRVKRISSRLKTGSFMGSEFSYEDLGGRHIEKFRHKFLRDSSMSGRPVWVLQQTPKEKSSGYSKQIVWMDKKYKNPIKIEYYDRKGELLKVGTFIGYKKNK